MQGQNVDSTAIKLSDEFRRDFKSYSGIDSFKRKESSLL